MSRVLVTGANGFIGSHLIEALLARGDEVMGLVRPTGDLRALRPAQAQHGTRLALVLGDLRDAEGLRAIVPEVEYVYHLAAELLVASEREFREAIVDGTRNLVQAVRAKAGSELRRFLHVSSLAAAGPAPEGVVLEETRNPAPISWYGTAKRDSENVVHDQIREGFPATIVRPAAVYGPRERDFSNGTFPLVRMGLMPRVGLGTKTASFVEVRELVSGMIAAAESDASLGKTYFLSDPRPYRQEEVIEQVADAMGTRVRIPVVTPAALLRVAGLVSEWARLFNRQRPRITRDKAREVAARNWGCSAAAAKADFGWESRTSLEDGMRAAVEDWVTRDKSEQVGEFEPLGDRARKTYLIAVLFGSLIEISAAQAQWYRFDPWWLSILVAVLGFGGMCGTVALVGRRWKTWVVFLVAYLLGFGAELANELALDLWEFNPASFGRIPGPWLRPLVLGIPVGLLPVAVNASVRAFYRLRLREG